MPDGFTTRNDRSSHVFGKRWLPQLAPIISSADRSMMVQSRQPFTCAIQRVAHTRFCVMLKPVRSHRQFVIASRAEVALFPSDSEVVRLFGKMARAEEHIFYNVLLYRLHYRRADIDVGCVTYQRFSPHNGYRTPLSCRTSKTRGVVELENEQLMLKASTVFLVFGQRVARARWHSFVS